MRITINAINSQQNPYFAGKKVIITKEKVLELRKTAKSEKEVYQTLGISMATYYKWLKKLGISSKLENYNSELSKISQEKFEELLKNKTPIDAICKFFKITTTAYYNLIDKFGLREKYIVGAGRKAVTKEKLQKLVEIGMSSDDICKELNIGTDAYYDLLKQFDIKTHAKIERERVESITKIQLETLINQGKNYDEIVKELGVSKSSINMLIDKFHIKTLIKETRAKIFGVTKEHIEALLEAGKSADEICEELHIRKRSYDALLNKLGVSTKLKRCKENIASITKEKLQAMVDSGLPVAEISKRLKITKATFYQLLKRLNIRYNYKHHIGEKVVPKQKLQNVVKDWENKDELLEELGIAEGTFYVKAKISAVKTLLSDSMKKTREINKAEVQEYLNQGATPQEICELFDLTPSQYNILLRTYGLENHQKKLYQNADKATKEKLEEMIAKGMSKADMCRELNITSATLRKKFYKFNLKY